MRLDSKLFSAIWVSISAKMDNICVDRLFSTHPLIGLSGDSEHSMLEELSVNEVRMRWAPGGIPVEVLEAVPNVNSQLLLNMYIIVI